VRSVCGSVPTRISSLSSPTLSGFASLRRLRRQEVPVDTDPAFLARLALLCRANQRLGACRVQLEHTPEDSRAQVKLEAAEMLVRYHYGRLLDLLRPH
jgi:hypothetical protein